jgi:hypothetical protein
MNQIINAIQLIQNFFLDYGFLAERFIKDWQLNLIIIPKKELSKLALLT